MRGLGVFSSSTTSMSWRASSTRTRTRRARSVARLSNRWQPGCVYKYGIPRATRSWHLASLKISQSTQSCDHLWRQADGTNRYVPFGPRHGNGAVAAVVEDLINAFMFLYFPDKTKIMNKSAVFFQTGVQNYIITSLDVTRASFVRDQLAHQRLRAL